MINGLLITKGHLEPVIATLGTLAVFRGAAFIFTSGAPIGIMSSDLQFHRLWTSFRHPYPGDHLLQWSSSPFMSSSPKLMLGGKSM